MRSQHNLLLALIIVLISTRSNDLSATADSPVLVADENVSISAQDRCHRMETTFAANPQNSANLVATSASSPGRTCRVIFYSDDGGHSWSWSGLPKAEDLVGDPQLTFDDKGAGYFSSMINTSDDKGPTVALYRSGDGGHSWQEAGLLPLFNERSWDHEMITFDRTEGRFRGRMYVLANSIFEHDAHKTDGRAIVVYSVDGGASFSHPVYLNPSGGGRANTSNNVVVLPDGTVVAHYSVVGGPSGDRTFIEGAEYLAASSDGGVNFSKAHQIFKWRQQQPDFSKGDPQSIDELTSLPSLAADLTSGQFQGRIYLTWGDWGAKQNRLWFSVSSDRGANWSRPVMIARPERDSLQQFQPAVTVNRFGVVLISWYETDLHSYDVYATASVDGGKSFLTPIKVSSAASRGTPLFGEGAATDIGDYMGLAADRNGDFHLTWMDKRSGASEIYTSKILLRKPN